MLPRSFAFVDVETTGMRFSFDRIIEIGILRVENNAVTHTFQSLVNPQRYLSPEIELMTGITSQELENAPTFRQIKDDILELLNGCVFVAHNVRFDYGFLKNELRRLEISFSPRHFCTVKLSKYLFPRYKHHNLDSLIERFNLSCQNRHRAFDDALVLWDFFQLIQKEFPKEKVTAAIEKALKKPSLPTNLSSNSIDTLPEGPGVYIFYGPHNVPLYVGKSIHIKERVLSHFQNNHSSSIEMKMSQQIEHIETVNTAGELGALLKESMLVKKLQPLYNHSLRIRKKLIVLKRALKNNYQTVAMESQDIVTGSDIEEIIGVFKSRKQAKDFLISLTEKYALCEQILGLEKTKGACFGYRLNRCKGACVGKEKPLSYNMRFIIAFSKHKIKPWPFKGPIAIEETDPLEEKTEKFLFDKWCYLRNYTNVNSNCHPEPIRLLESEPRSRKPEDSRPRRLDSGSRYPISSELLFDTDTYRILETYLRVKKNWRNIKTLSKYREEK